MSWLIENINVVYILLGIVALGFVTAGWVTRRVKWYLCAAIPLALIGLVLLLTQFVVTDRQQIEANINKMADAVIAGNADELLKHVSREFRLRNANFTRDQIIKAVIVTAAQHKVTEVKIREFEWDEVSRTKGTAKARFKANVFDRDSVIAVVFCIADFTLEDNEWKLRAIEFRDGRHIEQAIPLPFGP